MRTQGRPDAGGVPAVERMPALEVVRARVGCAACASGSLAPLADASTELDRQLRSLADRNFREF